MLSIRKHNLSVLSVLFLGFVFCGQLLGQCACHLQSTTNPFPKVYTNPQAGCSDVLSETLACVWSSSTNQCNMYGTIKWTPGCSGCCGSANPVWSATLSGFGSVATGGGWTGGTWSCSGVPSGSVSEFVTCNPSDPSGALLYANGGIADCNGISLTLGGVLFWAEKYYYCY